MIVMPHDTPRILTPDDPVPAHGSVVLRHGLTGTAYQRYYSDGLFYCVGKTEPLTYEGLFGASARVHLIHDASLYDNEVGQP